MSETIDKESKQRRRLAIDIDWMSDRYKTQTNIYTFPSPSIWTIEKNLYYLLKNSKQIDFDRKYFMRPDYLSFDEYGTVSLANLLMYVNTVQNIEGFDLDTVIVPSFQAIVRICFDKFPQKETDELTEVNW